jgi:hypothetical protein
MPKTVVMEESSVQWVLSKHPEYLSKILGIQLDRCLGTEVTTRFGRLDFLYQAKNTSGNPLLVVIELETGIDSSSKLSHCVSQLTSYLKLKDKYKNREVEIALIYARDLTPEKFESELTEFCEPNGIILKSYLLRNIYDLYNRSVDQLSHISGVSLGRAVALGITSLSWIKKFMLPFIIPIDSVRAGGDRQLFQQLWQDHSMLEQYEIEVLEDELRDRIQWSKLVGLFPSKTNFYVLKRLVEDFELIKIKKSGKGRVIELTEPGRRFRDEILIEMQIPFNNTVNETSQALTIGQQRLLLEILLNGNFTKLKVNIFHFLRFVHLTEGSWLIRSSSKLSKSECQYLNDVFRASYNSRTLKDLVLQTCTFCAELGLVKKLPSPDQVYDRLMFTTVGSRVYNYFESLLHVERERHQIPAQAMEKASEGE